MRDFVIRIREGAVFQTWVHVFYGPLHWAVEFDQDDMVSSVDVLAVAAVMERMYSDYEVQVGATQ